MQRRLIAVAAWASIAFIAYATLSRVGVVYKVYDAVSPMVDHPAIATYVHFEHMLAFAVAGFLFGLAYHRNLVVVCSIVLGTALLLEFAQTLTPDRHGTIVDALEKMAGGAVGILSAIALTYVAMRMANPERGRG